MGNAKKSFVIGEHYDDFISQQVESGRFNNASEVVRAGLRILEDHETKLANLRALIDEGDQELAEGKGIEYSNTSDLKTAILEQSQNLQKT